ncbi:unnamed protein product, partial [Aureobasidium mustum]
SHILRSDWNAQVLKVRVVCHRAGRVPNTNASDNHWSIYLIIGPAKIKVYDYVDSNSRLRHCDYEAITYFTVGMAYDLLVTQHHLDRYNMSGGGSGCRWWGWIRSDAAATLWPHLHFKYSGLQGPTPLSMVYGSFY